MDDPQTFMSELSGAEQSCLSKNGDPQRLLALVASPDLATPEVAAALIQCLEEETLLRLFLTGFTAQVGPLREQTSTCIRAGFAEFDIRAIMLGAVVESQEEAAMAASMGSFLVTLSCLNDEEWQMASPALDLNPNDREGLQCVMDELGGPAAVAPALQSDAGSPLMTVIGVAIGCNLQLITEGRPG